MNKKFSSFAFAGLIGLNLFRPGVTMDRRDSTPTGSPRPGVIQRLETKIENKIQEFKDKRATLSGVVTAVGTTNITVKDGSENSVQVGITDKTHLRRKFWGESKLTEISVNDQVQVVGKWTSDAKTEITAVIIRDLSIQKRKGTFFGPVKSISGNSFVFTTINRGEETVTIDSSTKLINRKEQTITSSDIKTGDKIRVKGMWDGTNKTITEVTEVKNFSLPVQTSP